MILISNLLSGDWIYDMASLDGKITIESGLRPCIVYCSYLGNGVKLFMSVYICEKCGAIDNTAIGGYWRNCIRKEPKMCSECNFGKWHGEFPKNYWDEFGVEKLLELERRNDGSMINATDFLKKKGKL